MNHTRTVFVTGADRGLGLALCTVFAQKGWRVYAGRFMPAWTELDDLESQYPGRVRLLSLDVSDSASVASAAATVAADVNGTTDAAIDMLINNAGIAGRGGSLAEGIDFEKAKHIYTVNSLGPLRMVQDFLPLMRGGGGMRRLCFISSEAGSVAVSARTDMYAYTMSKTALNMGIRRLHNHLSGEGFTFRVYHPGWLRSYMSGKRNDAAPVEPIDSATAAAEYFLQDTGHENALQMVDERGAVWPF